MLSLQLRALLPLLVLASGFTLGYLQPPALLFGLLFAAWIMLGSGRLPGWLWWSGGLLAGIALAAHLLPGFHPLPLWPSRQLSADAPPYALRLSWDKLLLAMTLLAWWLGQPRNTAPRPKTAWLSACATLLGVPLLALLLGLVGWQPKWPEGLWLWLAVNLGVTVLAEELLFRAWLQPALCRRLGVVCGIGLTAALFGAAHMPFSPLFALVATFAGLGYGLVFHGSGRLWPAVLLHGAVNLLHLLLLSYPVRTV